jgi:hypothetical protein
MTPMMSSLRMRSKISHLISFHPQVFLSAFPSKQKRRILLLAQPFGESLAFTSFLYQYCPVQSKKKFSIANGIAALQLMYYVARGKRDLRYVYDSSLASAIAMSCCTSNLVLYI